MLGAHNVTLLSFRRAAPEHYTFLIEAVGLLCIIFEEKMQNKGWRTNIEIFKTRESNGPELQAPASPTERQGPQGFFRGRSVSTETKERLPEVRGVTEFMVSE